jgi:hypothetical protein
MQRKLFNTAILTLYGTLLASDHVVLDLFMEEENSPLWNTTRQSAGLIAKNITREIARFAAGYSPINETTAEFLKSADLLDALVDAMYDRIEIAAIIAARHVFANGGSPRRVVYAGCQLLISKHKEIIKAVENMKEEMATEPLTIKEIDHICQQLTMIFEGVDNVELQKIIPLQLYNYLLGVEQILTILGREDKQKILLKNLSTIVCTTAYHKLFEPRISRAALNNCLIMLPASLINIVFDYCFLDCLDPSDKELIYTRLLFQVNEC